MSRFLKICCYFYFCLLWDFGSQVHRIELIILLGSWQIFIVNQRIVSLLCFISWFFSFISASSTPSRPHQVPTHMQLMYTLPIHIPWGLQSFVMWAFMKFIFVNVDMLFLAQLASHSVSYYSIQLHSYEICLHCYLFHADRCLKHKDSSHAY